MFLESESDTGRTVARFPVQSQEVVGDGNSQYFLKRNRAARL